MAQHRLILTSSGLDSPALESEFRRMLGSEPSTRTCWYIPTAPLRDGWPRAQVTNAMQEVGKRFGLTMAWIDPEYTTGDTLRAAIADKLGGRIDVIWAEMGNTYNLCYHIWKSGADKVITDAMDGGAIYVGASAGSIMAGRTCQMALWKNWDDQTCEGTVAVDWTDPELSKGLNLAGGRSIFPHANGRYAAAAWQRAQAEKHGHTDHEVVALADGEGLVIEGGAVRRL